MHSGYKVAGKLRDGVIVLKPKTKPKSFTSRQIRDTITGLRLGPGIAETRDDRRSKKG